LVESRPGQGTFVTTKVIPFVTDLSTDPQLGEGSADPESAAYLNEVGLEHREASASIPKVEVQAPPEEVSKRMRLPSGTQVVSRHQKRYIDRIPWSIQTSFYPMDFITKGADRLLRAEDIKGGTVRYLQETLGKNQIGYRDWITARRPDSTERDFFKIAHDAIMFELFRTGFDQDGIPMRVTVTAYPGDRNQFIFNVGDNLPPPQYGPADGS
jgi:GntR family transcriptional regulator